MVMKAGDLVSLSFGQLLVSHGVPLCFFGEKKRTRTGSWPLLSYAPWVLQLLSEFATRNFSTVLKSHVDQMKNTEMYQALSGFFSVSFNGDCSPITFDFTVYSESFNISIDPFCNLTIWPYIRAVVLCVFGFFAFRVCFDN